MAAPGDVQCDCPGSLLSLFTIHPCMKRCDSPLHGGRPVATPRAGFWELSLNLILPLNYSPYLELIPTSACPRYYGQVSIISQPRNQQ